MTKIKPYSKDRFVRISREILDKNYRTKLSMHAQKLLYGLASCLDTNDTMFPEWDIHIEGLFKYMNIESSNKRYEVVRDALFEIGRSPLEYKANSNKWGMWSWFSMVKFDSNNSNYVRICFSEQVKPFLLQLQEYCRLDAKYYINLSSNYSMWLYPLLRNVANKRSPYLELSLDEIRELTYNEDTPAYSPDTSRDANRNILKAIIGLERKRGEKYYSPITRKNNKGQIKEVGTIAEINQKSDLYVECDVLKRGRSINAIKFHVQFKSDTFQAKRKRIRQVHRTDFKKAGAKQLVIEEIKNGINPSDVSVPLNTVDEMARAQGKSVSQLLREMGYRREGERAIKV